MVIKSIDTRTVVAKFALNGKNVHPEAVKLIINSGVDVDRVVDYACRKCNGSFIITPEDISDVLKELSSGREEKKVFDTGLKDTPKEEVESKGQISILKDVTGKSTCRGTVEDFVAYFNSRYEKLYSILKPRVKAIPIGSLGRIKMEEVEVIGFADNVRELDSSKAMFELEDKTGRVRVYAEGKVKEQVMELFGDEVIGVAGRLRGRSIIADRIIFPDVPISNGNRKRRDFLMVFISDVHFGSNTFLKEEWSRFVKWLNGESENEKLNELAHSVKYIFVAGDLTDGVGIYPDQEKELEILDIYQQYEFAAEQFDLIREDIKIILSPGNHDAVRQAEPQPALPKEFSSLFPKNVIHVGNPAYVDVEGIKVLLYHGRSLDDIISRVPRLSYERPHEAVMELLKRRHLAPLYGERSPIAPEKEDYLVIDDVPDVIHSGHVHTYGTGFYRGVFVINSSTWQSQTEFQKKVNLNPVPGNVAVYQPGGNVYRLKFYSG
ncbi:DNA-directed DNA polymerase II small subunit [Geoglobus acetivorans]|uniref:DNA polymerase II small subunit n=1 Tax=Geoglobus acetivorans TaxID=565033 RepID=A0ABZ3H441_GEOAI|nr:DNA-directed DNA polymerase II small subunit [Geoglobus acetivorans]